MSKCNPIMQKKMCPNSQTECTHACFVSSRYNRCEMERQTTNSDNITSRHNAVLKFWGWCIPYKQSHVSHLFFVNILRFALPTSVVTWQVYSDRKKRGCTSHIVAGHWRPWDRPHSGSRNTCMSRHTPWLRGLVSQRHGIVTIPDWRLCWGL